MNISKREKKRCFKGDNFLEKLRELGENVGNSLVHDVIEGIPRNAIDQISSKNSGSLKPNEDLNLEEIKRQNESQVQLNREFFRIRQEERLIFKQQEQTTRLQIKAIQGELRKLIEMTGNLTKEIEIAAQLEPVEPGVYHLNFFEKLKELIITFRKRIEDASSWLSLFNQRAKKRNYYWAQVRKSGTKFMLSQERYMATQVG